MGAVNIIGQIPLTDISTYLVSLFLISLVGIILVEWCNRRFEPLISPLCDRISARRKTVVERESRTKARRKK